MDAIYLVRDGQQTGPFTRAQIDAMLARGEATPDTMAWYDGLPNWAALSTIVGSSSVPAAPPAPAPITAATVDAAVSEAGGYTTPELRHLGKCQNQLMLAFLISIVFNITAKVLDLAHAGLMVDLLVFLAALGVIGFAMYAAALLASALRYPVWGIVLLCIGLIIPCVSLIILLVLTIQSSKILKAAGVKIGLMGAKFD
jgi:hypothetical protein